MLSVVYVEPSYFRTLGIRLARGRTFPAVRRASEAVVNEAFVRAYFPGGDALGARLRNGAGKDVTGGATIVGVVHDARTLSLTEPPAPAVYFQYRPNPLLSGTTVLVRTTQQPQVLKPQVDAAWRVLTPVRLPDRVDATRSLIAGLTANVRMMALFLGSLAVVGLLLAATGLYGVVAYGVARRTREIGIRVALGATPRAVLFSVVRRAGAVAALGIAIGLAVGLVLARSVATLLFDVAPTDPATYAFVAVLLAGVALCAAYLPARRATRVDPGHALRYE